MGCLSITAGMSTTGRIDDTGQLHHHQAAAELGVDSAVDGVIAPDGSYFVTARDPRCDGQALMRFAAEQATTSGLSTTDLAADIDERGAGAAD